MDKIIGMCDMKNVLAADRCSSLSRTSLDKTMVVERLQSRKKENNTITFMPCANADGTEKT